MKACWLPQEGRAAPAPGWQNLGSPCRLLSVLRNKEWSSHRGSITLEVKPHSKGENSVSYDHENKGLLKKKAQTPSWPLSFPMEMLSPYSQRWSVNHCVVPWESSTGGNRVLYQMQEDVVLGTTWGALVNGFGQKPHLPCLSFEV